MSTVTAPAKLTWYLEITGRRDDGYHLLRSEMISLTLADSLEIENADTTSLTLRGSTRALEGVPSDESNLVLRALGVLQRRASVEITKEIPSGAGLGGGSSDAAAVLRWAGCHDSNVAARLGADVAFCVRGGRALVQGVGEKITPLNFESRDVTLILAPFSINTAAVYAAFDGISSPGPQWSPRNHLFEAACSVQPQLRTLCDFVAAETGAQVVLAGSGSTVFIEGFVSGLADAETLASPVGELLIRRAHSTPAIGE